MKKCLQLAFFLAGLLIFQSAQAQITISGNISRPDVDDTPLGNVPVFLTGDVVDVTFTDASGNYAFSVPEGGDYTVHPKTNSDPRNGVTTLDFVRIQNHIIGTTALDSPYKIIAADVDGDGMVSAFDLLQIQDLILYHIDEFPTDSWVFVNKEYVFIDEANPFTEPFPQQANLNSASQSAEINFYGIKKGDVNYSGNPYIESEPCDLGCANIEGIVFYDDNNNCTQDGDEQKLKDWLITATSPSKTYYGLTDLNGYYSLQVTPDDYEVTITPINALWTTCTSSMSISLEVDDAEEIDFAAQSLEDCHNLVTNLSTFLLRRCFETPYTIHYCNYGTVAAENAQVTLTLDPLLSLQSSTIPFSSQNDNSYTFDVGDVDVNDCGFFSVYVLTSCEAELGQTLCSESSISPESDCLNPTDWDGSNLVVEAECLDDEVNFVITNTGAAMTKALEYIVIEDDMIMLLDYSDTFTLASFESRLVTIPGNGSTWRIEVPQTSNHPFSEMVSAAIEGCGTNSIGESTQGFINSFPQWTASAAIDEDCVVVVGSWDPNDKAAVPTGSQSNHYIQENIDLEYLIRFQNTGTDTAFTVVIRDQLSEFLDLSTLRPLASSHTYQMDIKDNRMVEFTFPEIMLPDSAANEVESNGFIKFSIAQVQDNPLGTVIENNAAIYFDFNDPVITNTVFHTIGEDFLEIVSGTFQAQLPNIQMQVLPNPMEDVAKIKIDGLSFEDGKFQLYDLNGKSIRNIQFKGDALDIYKNELSSGLYVFKLLEAGTAVGTGKLMIK